MKLAIFDIDGTLTNTNQVDGECFVRAFEDEFGITNIETDWSEYPHTTDQAIAVSIFEQRWGRPPVESELAALKVRFSQLLQSRYSAEPELFAEIPGAATLVQKLQRDSSEWAVSVATGCWSASAELKLAAASIRIDKLVLASAEDHSTREDIVSAALSRALAFYRRDSFERIVSIGDGVWDVRTARNLEMAFLGIASGTRGDLLRTHGARQVIADFSDFDGVMRNLDIATIPGPPGD